jgi:hypothetical protein
MRADPLAIRSAIAPGGGIMAGLRDFTAARVEGRAQADINVPVTRGHEIIPLGRTIWTVVKFAAGFGMAP